MPWVELTREDALELMRLDRKYNTKRLSPELAAKKKEFEDAVQNAELFMARVRAVDVNMVKKAVHLKIELAALLAKGSRRGSHTVH